MAISLRRAGAGPDDPFRIVTAAGKVVADPDDPTKPLELKIGPDDIKVSAPPESPEIRALRQELETARLESQRERDARAETDRQAKVKAIKTEADTFAAKLLTDGKITAASQKGFADAYAVLSIQAAGLPLPDDLKAQAALENLKTAVAELPATGLKAPALNPDGTVPDNLQVLPGNNGQGDREWAKETMSRYYGPAATSK